MLPKPVVFILRGLAWGVGLLLVLIAGAWTFGALWFDVPTPFGRPAAWCYLLGALAALIFLRSKKLACAAVLGSALLVVLWWFTLQPSNDRDWEPDVALQPWAEVNSNLVTLHNVRNSEYHTGKEVQPHWETRTVNLSDLTGIDVALNYWGSSWMAHPIVSFQFRNAAPLAFSIEIRREKGETYSALGGLYRHYELMYIVADERDVIRVRTNYRKGEEVYLYRTSISPAEARERFLEYISSMNDLRSHPRWYNALTANCTTAIRSQRSITARTPWDLRILLNGRLDELFFQRGLLFNDGLSFSELRRLALINKAAQAADQSPDFSQLIREGRPGFGGR